MIINRYSNRCIKKFIYSIEQKVCLGIIVTYGKKLKGGLQTHAPSNHDGAKNRYKLIRTLYIYIYDGKPSTRQQNCILLPITK